MPLATHFSSASRVVVLACLVFGGCDVFGTDPLPTRAELSAEFETPARGRAILRTGSLRGGEDVTVSAQALGANEPETSLYVVFCNGETSAGAVYDSNAPYPSLRAGLDLEGSEGAVLYITDVADDGAVSGLFATDRYSDIVGRRTRVQGAFNARPVEPTYTCQR